MPQGKAYQQYFENTENKAELIDRYSKYIQQDQVRSKLKGNVIFNYVKAKDVLIRNNRYIKTAILNQQYIKTPTY